MGFLSSLFKPKPVETKASASIARERLQVVVRHQRQTHSAVTTQKPDYLAQLQTEMLEVIKKYIPVTQDNVEIDLEHQKGCSVLELNVVIPEQQLQNKTQSVQGQPTSQ